MTRAQLQLCGLEVVAPLDNEYLSLDFASFSVLLGVETDPSSALSSYDL